jgi:hypothetical protein
MKMKWIYNWFIHTDYHSGEMIRYVLRVYGFDWLERIWIKHMRRKLDADYRRKNG